MKGHRHEQLVLGLLGIAALGWSSAAQAQCMVASPDYDECFFWQLNQMQSQNDAAIQ